ncbi:hypothetical protein SJA_C1-07650 [Sphingobium indicum UT26S]|uniref:Uncharacterized protein n=1 Tax=Sphingobium indicum (strain DSM 16413 / CCM 7287 / MTCC 6362 / UT26 / NBRC 101211 / UT26S) TaxID=452662 RepID=D4YZ17_SPHIU|nr:hypothetical protein SJA_C1-07650 [Sphingobium indicum UT26S]
MVDVHKSGYELWLVPYGMETERPLSPQSRYWTCRLIGYITPFSCRSSAGRHGQSAMEPLPLPRTAPACPIVIA